MSLVSVPAAESDVAAPLEGPLTEAHLAALYPEWYGRLSRYFVACGCHAALAHDLTQDSFAAALRGLAGFRGDAKLSTWLWAIARNTLLAELRRKRPLDQTEDVELETLIFADDAHLSELNDCVRRGFARFAQRYPERAHAVYLVYWGGWAHAELADYLGKSSHACTVELARSRELLVPYLRDCDEC